MLPIGLGARDTLRLEARLTLYGNDIDDTTSPYEAGLGYFVRLEKGDFIGSATLAVQKAETPAKKLIAFIVSGRGIPRHGYPILAPTGAVIGHVTSGSYSPTLEKDIGMGYVPAEYAAPGTLIGIDVRGKARPAEIIKGRFVPSQGRRRL
jgi:aminomethyltransferase